MKPLYLSIKGLFSYREEVEIDFQPLTAAGLFGIFGPVGSGKSTILDAITLALYGENDRLNARDSRNYNLMNLQSSTLKVHFRFIHSEQEYLFTVEGSRNSKKYEDVRSFKRRAYKIEDGAAIALHDDNRSYSAREILGLTYDNFRRTIIIPQGRFQEFLQLRANDRSTMLKELFNLEKFDLSPAASSLLQEAKGQKIEVQSKLSMMEDISAQELQRYKRELAGVEEKANELYEKKSAVRKELQKLDQLEQLFSQLKSAESALETLESQRSEIEERQAKLNQYEECRLFSAPLQRIDEYSSSYRQLTRGAREAELERKRLAQEQSAGKEHLEQVGQRHLQKDQAEARALRLEALSRRKELQTELDGLSSSLEQITKRQAQAAAAVEKLQLERTKLQNRLELLENETALFAEMNAIAEWYGRRQKLLDQAHDLKKQLEQYRQESEQYVRSLQSAAETVQSLSVAIAESAQQSEETAAVYESLETLGKELGSFYRELTDYIASLESSSSIETPPSDSSKDIEQYFITAEEATGAALRSLRRRMLDGDEQQSAKKLSRLLRPEQPCPVCGSFDHPSPAYTRAEGEEEAFHEVSDREKPIEALEAVRSSLIQQKTACAGSLDIVFGRLEMISQVQSSLTEIEQHLSRHRKEFVWTDFSPDDETGFREAWGSAQSAHAEAAEVRKAANKIESEIKVLEEEQHSQQTQLHTLQQKQAVLQHRISEETAKIGDDIESEYLSLDSDRLSEQAAALRAEIQRTEDEYKLAEQKQHQREIDLNTARVTEQERRQQRRAVAEEIVTSARRLAEQLSGSDYSLIREVRNILELDIDLAAGRREVETFYRSYSTAKEKVSELHSQTQGIEYSSVFHQETREKTEQLEQNYSELLQEKAVLQSDLQSIQNRLTQKEALQRENERVELRLENLNELSKLFKGQGFVNFVATRYLHELCARANDRFFQLTHKQLRLEVNRENDFVIRDYLNGGRVRSVKTLSGGQLFQASFSLALALADSIHQNKESFFFLDEGFGSLDRRSLQDVFDTLKSLRRENRIVGVISHVEELREEIPVSLQVREDAEAGSQIVSSV
ncbi:MAG: SMC family ATPase [Spirochaetaceae bacterium]|nr:SMC family ATPase [Spirochaetaceae bacterium]MCF7950515.1 SMC family ATPase [Spirochaetaceae bacterium]